MNAIKNQENLSNGNLKDLMLKYSFKGNGNAISSTEIHRELLTEISQDEIRFLLKEILENQPDISAIRIARFETYVCANGLTQKFLDQGGFSKTEQDAEKELKRQSDKDNLELKLAKSNLEANKLNKKIAKQNEKNEKKNRIGMWFNIAIGILNLGLIVWQIIKSK